MPDHDYGERLASIEVTQTYHTALLKRIDAELGGNGAPGLKTRVDRLERTEQRRIESDKARAGWIAAAVLSGIGALTAVGVAWMKEKLHI